MTLTQTFWITSKFLPHSLCSGPNSMYIKFNQILPWGNMIFCKNSKWLPKYTEMTEF